MKRVAILTTHRANNFGAVLQAYSLVMACRELGADAEILDWRHPYFERSFHRAWKMHRNPIPALKHLWRYMTYDASARHAFNAFRERIPMSKPILDMKGLEAVGAEYDSYIVGSDQVWNPQLATRDATKFDRAMLLNFVQGKSKNAYAASIGEKEISPPSIVPEFRSAWQTYDCISMRERAGADYVSKIIGRKVPTVLDPVLLHDLDWWNSKVAPVVGMPKGPYVLIYNVHQWRRESSWLCEQAYDYAAAHQFQVVELRVPEGMAKWTKNMVSVGPDGFVRLIAGASAVFANSFHATAFSWIFKKPFFLHKITNIPLAYTRFDEMSRSSHVLFKEVAQSGYDTLSFADFSLADLGLLEACRKESFEYLRAIVG